MNIVEKFWSKHIVGNAKKCKTKAELLNKIRWRFDLYPNYDILMGLHDNFEKKRILDFGCGPGWDLSWIALTDMPSRIVGMDVSQKALDIAHHHLGLARRHDARFIKVEEEDLHKTDDTFDIIFSSGVIHHVSRPDIALLYLKTFMHNKTELRVMVYNKNSIFYRVLVPLWGGKFEDYVDGGKCPIARCYTPTEFRAFCGIEAKLKAEFVGSYHDPREVPYLDEYGGRYGGLGGVYRITRR
jgi:ubiquinone/menaquinone biosynthesis C-methylase UbiE